MGRKKESEAVFRAIKVQIRTMLPIGGMGCDPLIRNRVAFVAAKIVRELSPDELKVVFNFILFYYLILFCLKLFSPKRKDTMRCDAAKCFRDLFYEIVFVCYQPSLRLTLLGCCTRR